MKNYKLYIYLTTLFAVSMVLANTIASKMIQIGPWTAPAGVLVFPITYILNDIFAEVYGFKNARRVIWIGFATNLLAVLIYQLTVFWPSPDFFAESAPAFGVVLGSTWRLLLAGFIAFLFGSYVNSVIVSKLKVLTKGKFMFMRLSLSTLVGELLDSLIFITIAFFGQMPVNVLITMIFTQAGLKVLYEVVLYPVTRIVIKKVKKIEDVDTFDYDEKYRMVGR